MNSTTPFDFSSLSIQVLMSVIFRSLSQIFSVFFAPVLVGLFSQPDTGMLLSVVPIDRGFMQVMTEIRLPPVGCILFIRLTRPLDIPFGQPIGQRLDDIERRNDQDRTDQNGKI